jgi:hypothetical protein
MSFRMAPNLRACATASTPWRWISRRSPEWRRPQPSSSSPTWAATLVDRASRL